jgi:hypothetical protein
MVGMPGVIAALGSDEAGKYLDAKTLWILRNTVATLSMMIAGLSAYRSKIYSAYKANGGARRDDTEFPQPTPIRVTPPAAITIEKPASSETIVAKQP